MPLLLRRQEEKRRRNRTALMDDREKVTMCGGWRNYNYRGSCSVDLLFWLQKDCYKVNQKVWKRRKGMKEQENGSGG